MDNSNIITLGEDRGPGSNVGLIAAANEARFTQSHYSEAVTNFIVNIAGTDIEKLIAERDILAPSCHVGRRFEFKKSAGGLAFLADLDDTRAIGAAFNKVEDKRESVNSKTMNRGLTITIDRDDMIDGDIEVQAQTLQSVLVRNDIKRINTLLLANDTNTAKTWGSSADPDGDVMAELNTALIARGLWPNTVVYGSTAWIKRRGAYVLNTGNGVAGLAALSAQQVAETLGAEKVHLSKSVAKTSKTGTKASIFANLVFAYYADAVVSKNDASNLKRFYTPTRSGTEFAVYVEEHDKTVDVTVEQYSTPAVTDSTGIRSLTIS